MIGWITVLLTCQLLGEAVSTFTKAPIPGPVCGMALLFAGLVIHGHLPEQLERTSNGLLSNLSLMFVPAGAGVMLHFQLLGREWLPLLAGVFISTALTVAITSALMAHLSCRAALQDSRAS